MLEVRKAFLSSLRNLPETDALLKEYADESAIKDLPHPNEKMPTYYLLEDSGVLHSYGAFVHGLLVGFIVMLASELPHYGLDIATIESFFVTKSARRTGAGIKLLHASEAQAKELGCKGVLLTAPVESQLAAYLNIRKDYKPTNVVFFKRFK